VRLLRDGDLGSLTGLDEADASAESLRLGRTPGA
jgi:hypothetical protein